ncbi:hypothetical protein [Actinomycetospora sp.]|jgi:hypothetical protein|uniref:hypothetical protein n=1 Tax=Actinomycetospora sp. TaxID=1872135 RepID=UPI002F3ECC41
MAIAFMFEAASMAQSDYDRAMDAMGLGATDGPYPDGLLAHLAGAADGGRWRVIDVWETEEHADEFYGSAQFAPVREGGAEFGITSTPWPLHRADMYAQFHQLV